MLVSKGGIMQDLSNFYLEQGIGYTPKGKHKIYHDLDYLAGTWPEKEAAIFNDNIKAFEKVDKEL